MHGVLQKNFAITVIATQRPSSSTAKTSKLFRRVAPPAPEAVEGEVPAKARAAELGGKPLAVQNRRDDLFLFRAALEHALPRVRVDDDVRHGR